MLVAKPLQNAYTFAHAKTEKYLRSMATFEEGTLPACEGNVTVCDCNVTALHVMCLFFLRGQGGNVTSLEG